MKQGLMFKCLSLIFLCRFAIAQDISSCAPMLDYIQKNMQTSGTLRNSDGFVYVDVEDAYVHELIRFIQQEGFEEPPYFGSAGLVGAHITVVYPEEMKKYSVKSIEECGAAIHFTPRTCQIIHPPLWQEIDEVYFIAVDAPQLDDLREKYGLPKREYDFHITIGIKPKIARSAYTQMNSKVGFWQEGALNLSQALRRRRLGSPKKHLFWGKPLQLNLQSLAMQAGLNSVAARQSQKPTFEFICV